MTGGSGGRGDGKSLAGIQSGHGCATWRDGDESDNDKHGPWAMEARGRQSRARGVACRFVVRRESSGGLDARNHSSTPAPPLPYINTGPPSHERDFRPPCSRFSSTPTSKQLPIHFADSAIHPLDFYPTRIIHHHTHTNHQQHASQEDFRRRCRRRRPQGRKGRAQPWHLPGEHPRVFAMSINYLTRNRP